MDKLSFNNIIRIPKRKCEKKIIINKNNPINYWELYENTFMNKNTVLDIIIHESNINISQMSDFIDYINNIKYNFYGLSDEDFLQNLLTEFLLRLNKKENTNIKKIINEVFNLNKKNIAKLKLYFTCIDIVVNNNKNLKINEILLFETYTELNNIIKETPVTHPSVLIKLNIQIDNFLDVIVSSKLKDNILKNIIINTFSNKLIDSLQINFMDTIKIIFKWKGLYEKTVNALKFNNKLLHTLLENINIKFSEKDYLNAKLSYDIVNIFKLLNDCEYSLLSDITLIKRNYNSMLEKNTNLLSYLCASIHIFMIKKKDLAIQLIKFQQFNENKIDFLTIYKQYLQKRSIYKFNFENEKLLLNILKEYFKEKLNKYLDIIINCIHDMKISEHINKEIHNLDITIKSPEYKNILYKKKKLNITILSTILWNDMKNYKYDYKPNIPLDVKIYTSIIKSYYKKKYDNRNMYISHDDSTINIQLKNLKMKLSLSYYYVIKFIANSNSVKSYKACIGIKLLNNSRTSSEKHSVYPSNMKKIYCYNTFISDKLKIPVNHINEIIIVLLANNIIIKKKNGLEIYFFNKKICESKNKIDLTKSMKIEKDKIIQENNYDKENLIDCYLIKIVKKEDVSFGKYIYLLRKKLNGMFVPTDNMIKNRLKKMILLGYVKCNKKNQKYTYIP